MKAGFVAHLDEALRASGLNPFLDKASLRKGDPAFRCIQTLWKRRGSMLQLSRKDGRHEGDMLSLLGLQGVSLSPRS